MNATLPPLYHTIASARPPKGRLAGLGQLLVAAIYALTLLAAPIIVRYAPAPSATPIATEVVHVAPAPHADCAVRAERCPPASAW